MAVVNFGRTETAQLVTPKGFVFFKEVHHALTDANRDLLREGHWLMETATSQPGVNELNLVAAAINNTTFATDGIPRFCFIDGDRHDVDWSEGVTILDGWGWRARTTMFNTGAGDLDPGVFCTLTHGASPGLAGSLELAATNEVAVAQVVANDGTWVDFVALQPFLAP